MATTNRERGQTLPASLPELSLVTAQRPPKGESPVTYLSVQAVCIGGYQFQNMLDCRCHWAGSVCMGFGGLVNRGNLIGASADLAVQ